MAKRKAQSKVESLGVKELVENLFRANASYDEIREAVKQATGEDVSDSGLSRFRTKWSSAQAQLQEAKQQVETLAQVLERKPDVDFSSAAMGLLWTKLLGALADTDRAFETADLVDVARITVAARRAEQRDQVLQQQARRLKMIEEKAEDAAKDVDETLKAAGLSDEAAATIREKILGVAHA